MYLRKMKKNIFMDSVQIEIKGISLATEAWVIVFSVKYDVNVIIKISHFI